MDSILTGFENDGRALQRFYESGENSIAQLMQRLESLDVDLENNRALDFGCGIGRLTSALSVRFNQTWGLDISETMIEIAMATASTPDCKYAVLNEPGLNSFESNYFDFAISLLVLQHIEPAHGPMYVAELLRVLKPGGVLVLQVPDAPNWSPLGMRLRLMRALPGYLKRVVRTVLRRPEHILMHGIKETAVLKIAAASGAECVSVDRSSVNGWEDRTYILTRSNDR